MPREPPPLSPARSSSPRTCSSMRRATASSRTWGWRGEASGWAGHGALELAAWRAGGASSTPCPAVGRAWGGPRALRAGLSSPLQAHDGDPLLNGHRRPRRLGHHTIHGQSARSRALPPPTPPRIAPPWARRMGEAAGRQLARHWDWGPNQQPLLEEASLLAAAPGAVQDRVASTESSHDVLCCAVLYERRPRSCCWAPGAPRPPTCSECGGARPLCCASES